MFGKRPILNSTVWKRQSLEFERLKKEKKLEF